MISWASAIRYDREALSGRNLPLLVSVETTEGEEYEVFLKPSGRPELSVTGLAAEVLAACLAGHLGLPICRPFLVELAPEWIVSIPDSTVRDMLSKSNPVAFGSQSAGLGWRPWVAEDILTQARRAAALAIFAFDAFIENPDRKPSNPNLLVKGDALRIIDHELALRVMGIFPRPAPWKEGNLAHMMVPDGHLFAGRLKGSPLDLIPIREAWSGLTDDHLSDYEACLPLQWADAMGMVAAALTHVRTVRDRIDDCLEEVGRALS
jgi:hypothetical protein